MARVSTRSVTACHVVCVAYSGSTGASARPKLLRTYMPTLLLKEAREALQKWGEELETILVRSTTIDEPCLRLIESSLLRDTSLPMRYYRFARSL